MDFGFDDDFFDDDDFQTETATGPEESMPLPPVTAPEGEAIEIMLLYDEGGLRESLSKCMAQTDYAIVDAYNLQTAKEAMAEHPRLGIVVSNTTVGGDDAASILRALTAINPDIICIICTDIIDLLSFTSLINTAPIYKILTFPLDIDKELIPALSEIAAVSLVRRVSRDELNGLIDERDRLDRTLHDTIRINKMRKGAMKREFMKILDLTGKVTEDIAINANADIKKKIAIFQKNITERFFLTLSPKEDTTWEYLISHLSSFIDPENHRSVTWDIKSDTVSTPAVRSRVCFIIWLLLYSISLCFKNYKVTMTVEYRAATLAYLDITLNKARPDWDQARSLKILKSYIGTAEGVVEEFVNTWEKNEEDVRTTYKITLTTSADE